MRYVNGCTQEDKAKVKILKKKIKWLQRYQTRKQNNSYIMYMLIKIDPYKINVKMRFNVCN